jgi:hypothetical protein
LYLSFYERLSSTKSVCYIRACNWSLIPQNPDFLSRAMKDGAIKNSNEI